MHIKILGSAAGGGFPQWNCFCDNCCKAREGKIKATVNTQSSIVLLEGPHRILINASPDIHRQMTNLPLIKRSVRDDLFSAIILLDSQLDHTLGLLSLRESNVLRIYATAQVADDLNNEFSVLKVLAHYCEVQCETIQLNTEFYIPGMPQIAFCASPLESKAPPYSQRRHKASAGDTIGLIIRDQRTQKKLFYAPSIGAIDVDLFHLLSEMDCILVDGTFWHEDEMQQRGVGIKSARDMGHLPLMGENGMLNILKKLSYPRKVLTHINNTNPILNPNSIEYAELQRHQVEVGYDGMDIRL